MHTTASHWIIGHPILHRCFKYQKRRWNITGINMVEDYDWGGTPDCFSGKNVPWYANSAGRAYDSRS